ncbi:hypothetical protein [Algoriphagus sp. CAU 1675]|uniref:hypothetical protein n=1 Tax=Algoriphagus sp. CAU 1675 TaxID=3032597 RepID=UPI0023DC5CBF|nr:hypothetical protein [Algoriphagus sp. CAU 1675]MDF2157205.1 hypothetical protein [Algoriphagus sp. CAU 1675]
MKTLYLLLAGIFLAASPTMAQDSPENQPKSKTYKFLGSSYKYQNEDGKWSLEWKEDSKFKTETIHKKRKFETEVVPEVGINIWVPSKNAPEIKPWGSWNVGINWQGILKPSKNFHLKTALGVSWYNFKFEDPNIQAVKTPDGLEFIDYNLIDQEGFDPIKSKISSSFANLSIVPTLLTNDGNFRLGIGAYAGLRLGGRGKFVYEDAEGDKQRIFEKSNMYFNNYRYGTRLEIGIGDANLFFNYDLNELFHSGKGPEVNAISFGLIII